MRSIRFASRSLRGRRRQSPPPLIDLNPIGALMVRVSVDRQDRSPCYFDNGVARGRGVN